MLNTVEILLSGQYSINQINLVVLKYFNWLKVAMLNLKTKYVLCCMYL